MANCNKLFLDYEGNLKISKTKNDKLKASKDAVRESIRKYFKDNHSEYNPEFYIQGSYKMKTTIVTKDDECDIDDGVYFKTNPDNVTGTTLQKWVKNAVENQTDTPPQHKKKCLRVIYKSDYYIDLPVYFFPVGNDHPSLAVKDSEMEESDPKEVIDWYVGEKDAEGQLNRLVKYFKGWGDYKRNKMPSGLAMTILVANNIQYKDQNDIAMRDTLIQIKAVLDKKFECTVPATPYDDLFADYDDTRKNNFLTNLDSFIEDAKKAVDESNQLSASKLWRKHFGGKFPEGADEDIDAKQSALNAIKTAVLSKNAFTQKDGSISNDSNGVKNLPHRNYGG